MFVFAPSNDGSGHENTASTGASHDVPEILGSSMLEERDADVHAHDCCDSNEHADHQTGDCEYHIHLQQMVLMVV